MQETEPSGGGSARRSLPARAAGGLARFARRLAPDSWRGRAALLGGLVLLVALVLGARYYFGEHAESLADDYRAEASPALRKATSAMDRVYESFDTYVAENALPRSELRGADDLEELKRRVLPVLDDAEAALRDGQRAIRSARKQLRRTGEQLAAVPDPPPLLGDAEPIRESEQAAEMGRRYARECQDYLRSYEKHVRYALDVIELDREGWQRSEELSADASLEETRSHFAKELEESNRARSRYLALDPPPGAEALHELNGRSATAAVDFFEDGKRAFENLDAALFEDARRDFLDELKRIGERFELAYWRFTAKSEIQRKSRSLSRQADELERRYADLGSGATDISDPHRRPEPPRRPRPDSGGGGGDKRIS